VNIPNLHINFHLRLHAWTYANLVNTGVGTKEMVHRIFKGMVPRTNRKNIELDLLKRYTTLFAIRHLIDGGIDSRFLKNSQGFIDISRSIEKLFSDWFIANNSSPDSNEIDDIKGLVNVY
jgi:hypothetical protein